MTTTNETSTTKEIIDKLEQTKGIAQANVDLALQRGESLQELEGRTAVVSQASKQFSKTAQEAKYASFLHAMKTTAVVTGILLFIGVIIGLLVIMRLK